ncbi:ABC transporter ATP-binding protein [Knoellia flava TL1]|uniref:ABC transporter ATP-binding protein n=2 Tax=Knoellia flava TaxID=913969 RepID=A0A8H9FVH5_9MICO|nr:ATP-binding cassette domain-containing protein [Knoellia flava]KGN35291.1 ABC transporter ATP-binding protein [Knoellia flava TL1]GGB77767.1 ABC transporter ATP-binding protein [Knoellia flava]
MAQIEVIGLTRSFGELRAVDDVSFTVPGGILTGFVGGNGAGKTTTMRLIMGLLAAHGGEVRWGDEPMTTQVRRRIGYMPEERGLYPKQKVLDQLVYLGELSGMTAADAKASVLEHLDRFGLRERASERVEKLSLGNQQRVQIIAALMTTPDALILDEPFSGLDPSAVDSMADLLREHASRGIPVLFSSHQLDLVERLCDRLVVLAHGRVVATGTVEELRGRGPELYRLTLGGDAGWVRDVDGIHVHDVDGSTALVEPDDDSARQALLRAALERGDVVDFARQVPALSDIYREVTA